MSNIIGILIIAIVLLSSTIWFCFLRPFEEDSFDDVF
jgi:hypothetical protein